MWQKILETFILNNLNEIKDIDSYCNVFFQTFNIKKQPVETVKHHIHSYNDKIFPEEDFLFDTFNNGLAANISQLFFYFKNLDLNLITLENKKPEHYLEIDNLHFFKMINFDSSILLSKDEYDRTLSFIFLFFLPGQKVRTMLRDIKQNQPLIANSRITNEHFNMLLFLMQTYEKQEYSMLQHSSKNINHMLIESFLKNNNNIYCYDKNIDWQNLLPKDKMYKLFKLNIGLRNFDKLMDNSIKNIFKGIEEELTYCEREYAAINLDNKLQKNNIERKIISKI